MKLQSSATQLPHMTHCYIPEIEIREMCFCSVDMTCNYNTDENNNSSKNDK